MGEVLHGLPSSHRTGPTTFPRRPGNLSVVRTHVVTSAVIRAGLAGLLTTGSLLLTVVPVARAATFDSQPVLGFQQGISCLTSRLCVIVGYNNEGIGDVVRVHDGVPAPGTAIAGSKALYSVSCAESAGCAAIGVTSNGASPVVVTLNSSGSVVGSKVLSVAPGVSLTRIACVTPGNCVLSGVDVFASPETLEVAHWDGSALSVHKTAGPAGATDPTLEGLSCSGAACVAVGSAFKGANSDGLVLSIADGKPAQLRVAAGDSIYGASCVSTTLCYGAGFNRSGGVVLTIDHGPADCHRPSRRPLRHCLPLPGLLGRGREAGTARRPRQGCLLRDAGPRALGSPRSGPTRAGERWLHQRGPVRRIFRRSGGSPGQGIRGHHLRLSAPLGAQPTARRGLRCVPVHQDKVAFLFGELPDWADPDDPDDRDALISLQFSAQQAGGDDGEDDAYGGDGTDDDEDKDSPDQLRAAFRSAVANQIANDDPPDVWATAQRLLAMGLDREMVLGELVMAMIPQFQAALDSEGPYDLDAYRAALASLPLANPADIAEALTLVVRESQPIVAEELLSRAAARLSVPVEQEPHKSMFEHLLDRAIEDGSLDYVSDDMVVEPATLFVGTVLTHRLTEAERSGAYLEAGVDLVSFEDEEALRGPGGATLEFSWRESLGFVWAGPEGWLEPFPAGAVVAAGYGEEGTSVEVLDNQPTVDPSAVATLRAAYDEAVREVGLPVSTQEQYDE